MTSVLRPDDEVGHEGSKKAHRFGQDTPVRLGERRNGVRSGDDSGHIEVLYEVRKVSSQR